MIQLTLKDFDSHHETHLDVLSNEEFYQLISEYQSDKVYYKKGMRLSIAGVQSKTSLLIKNDKKYLPNFHNPSTHILKFDSKNVDNVLVNEYFITKLAQSLGLNVSNMQLKKIGQMSYLEIKRFDRSNDGMRINQEDFCQILSIRPASKYQNEGGPSFRKIVDFVRNNFTNSSKDIVLLSKILVYNFLVGNCDYHGKIFQLPIKTLLN